VYCSSNVRQILMANMQYGQEHHDTWPGRADNGVEDYDGKLCSWVPSGKTTDPRFDLTKGVLYSLLKNEKVFRCPTDPFPSKGLSYAINANLYVDRVSLPSKEPGVSYPKPGRFNQRSDQLVIMVDEGSPNDGNFKPIYPSMDWADEPKWYHHGGASFGFFDGHGVTVKSNNTLYTYHKSLVWFPDEDNLEIKEP